MRAVPLNAQTLYADLCQSLELSRQAGTVYEQHGHSYIVERLGSKKVHRHLGRVDDPQVKAWVKSIGAETERAKVRRKTVRMLKTAGLMGPTHKVGSILSVLSKQGLFEPRRLVLVGTLAASVYPAMLGVYLSAGILMTQDVDLSLVSVAAFNPAAMKPIQMLSVLLHADPTLQPINTVGRPHKFRGSDGIEVEFLSPPRRGGLTKVDIPTLSISAEVLPFMDYLIENPLPAAILHGSGVLARVPQPARYAVHKLIVAQKRPVNDVKRHKDLWQAKEIIEALKNVAPDEIKDALKDAISKGKKWREPINASLKEIGRPIETAGG